MRNRSLVQEAAKRLDPSIRLINVRYVPRAVNEYCASAANPVGGRGR